MEQDSSKNASGSEDPSSEFSIVEVRKQIFDKFPAELKCQLVYRHFYTELDEEASQLSLQWFALLITYFCSLCRLEGRRVQYTSNGQSERFGAEFSRAHQRAAVLFERVTTTYRKILMRYNTHSTLSIRKREGPKVIKEQYKLNFKYADGAKCDIEKHSYKREPAFLYSLDEMRFHEELVNFTVQMMKRAFTDERLQVPIVAEVTRLFRSNAFSFQYKARESAVVDTRRNLEEAQGVTSILHNCHRLANRLVAPTEHVPLKLALRQRTPFVASHLNHPLLTTLSYQRAFARREVERPSNATFHVRLAEGEESPHRREAKDLKRSLNEVRGVSPVRRRRTADSRFSKEVRIPSSRRRSKSRSNSPPSTGVASRIMSRDRSTSAEKSRKEQHANDAETAATAAGFHAGFRSSSASGNSSSTKKQRGKSPAGGNRSQQQQQQHRLGAVWNPPAAAGSKDYWDRVGTSKEENEFTVETHQPMFAPSHRALSSLTPVGIIRARQVLQKEKEERENRDSKLTQVPADSKLPKLFDFDRAAAEEAEMAAMQVRAEGPIDHATEILYGRGTGLGQAPGQKPQKASLAARFSTVAKRVAKASGVRTNDESQKRTEQKAVDRLVSAAASAATMSDKIRRQVASTDPSLFFVAPIDPATGQEDFTLYCPTAEIDAVYQQLAHGVQLTHFSVPLDINCTYENGLLVPDS